MDEEASSRVGGGNNPQGHQRRERSRNELSSTSTSPAPAAIDGAETPSRPSLSAFDADKLLRIQHACNSRNFDGLVALASDEHGLVTDEIRRRAWPLLLGYTRDDGKEAGDDQGRPVDWHSLPLHRDEHQVRLDVDRSFIYYPDNQAPKELDRRKQELSDVITEVLRRYPYLCYFQGYHDICQVFLLVLGAKECVPAVAHLSNLRIRDFMLPSLAPAVSHLRLLPSILSAVDNKLCKHLSQTQPFFALAATLTLYAHDIQEYGDIARLFDVLLAREASFSVYLFAEIVLQRKEELLDIPPDEPEMLHSVLCKLPKPLNLESLIANSIALTREHPPESLHAWSQVSSYSVLKTARSSSSAAQQSLAHGMILFLKQNAELRRAEMRQKALNQLWAYRRPVGSVGLAVLVGVVAWWLRRNGGMGLFSSVEGILHPVLKRAHVFWASIAKDLQGNAQAIDEQLAVSSSYACHASKRDRIVTIIIEDEFADSNT